MSVFAPSSGRSEGVLDGGLDAPEVALAAVLELALAPADLRADVQLREWRIDQVGVEGVRAFDRGPAVRAPAGQVAVVVELGHRVHQVRAKLRGERMAPRHEAASAGLRVQPA